MNNELWFTARLIIPVAIQNSAANRKMMFQNCQNERGCSDLGHRPTVLLAPGGLIWTSDLMRNSAPLYWHSTEKRLSTAGAFPTLLRRSTPWSTPGCCRSAQKES